MRISRSHRISISAALRAACRRAGLPLAAVLLVAFLPVISANAQSASQGASAASQDSSQPAASQSAAASDSASTTPAMQDASAPPPQSLGAAARAANAKKQQTKAKHVYTDDDVSSIGGTISVVGDGHSSGDAADADTNADGQAAAPSAGAQDEKYWRDRANQIKNAIADVDRQIDAKKDEIAKAGATSFDPSAGLSQGVIVIHDRNAELKELEDRKASLENQLDQLADEGRRAGADSGWFR